MVPSASCQPGRTAPTIVVWRAQLYPPVSRMSGTYSVRDARTVASLASRAACAASNDGALVTARRTTSESLSASGVGSSVVGGFAPTGPSAPTTRPSEKAADCNVSRAASCC